MGKGLLSLYGVQFGQLVLPLLTLPFLARTLGPSSLGELAAVQSLFIALGAIIEYGFNLSASRKAAIHRHNSSELSRIFSEVLGAKIILFLVFSVLSSLIYVFIPVFNSQTNLYWLGFLSATINGFNFLWFFQGVEKLPKPAAIEFFAKSIQTGCLLIFIHDSNDTYLVLMLQIVFSLLAISINLNYLLSFVKPSKLSISMSILALREGMSMFTFRALTLFYTSANSAILRLFDSPSNVSYYSTSDRLTAATYTIFNPITQILFPRISFLVKEDLGSAKNIFRRSFFIIMTLSIISVIAGYFTAPVVIPLIFGDEFEPSVEIFRILIFNTPLIAISTLFGMQWMIPNGMHKEFNSFIAVGAIISIISTLLLVPTYKVMAMAWTMVFCESVIASLIVGKVMTSSINPFKHIR
ncbi:oligosaccharide flippase family protein [Deinococcus sp. 23YEL01]|uniref:oligosaccharide flippase family protein n=1 Tax=Deinococcus sp. 23YEL01 TaxID=2745871 RepID=UPI001E59986F|nr:oligosaccharide flippase family protein [Deinococcus sp. 23YEL01]